jgi:hypothetical protein
MNGFIDYNNNQHEYLFENSIYMSTRFFGACIYHNRIYYIKINKIFSILYNTLTIEGMQFETEREEVEIPYPYNIGIHQILIIDN